MSGRSIHRAVTILVSAALLASLAAATVAAPAAAAKPRCFGRTATIVGTAKGEVIKGTAGADVIVARGGHDKVYGKGGNDIICGNKGNDTIFGAFGRDTIFGGTGNDKLHGQTGPDRLLGGPGDDAFDGGTGVDLCAQGTGIGPRANCERPPVVVAPPPPPPSGPTLIPLTGILAVAYSDIDGLDGYSSGDVMIGQIVDTNGSGGVNAGDTVVMGRYPRNLSASVFGSWMATSRVITSVDHASPTYLDVNTSAGAHQWLSAATTEYYLEVDGSASLIMDLFVSDSPNADMIDVSMGSPGAPAVDAYDELATLGDQQFIDVTLTY